MIHNVAAGHTPGLVQAGGEFISVPFTTSLSAQLFRSFEKRRYLFLLNQDTNTANVIYLGVGFPPTIDPVTGFTNGIPIFSGGGYYEPLVAPWNDLFVIGNVAGIPGTAFIVVS